jgi:hypothetical protein
MKHDTAAITFSEFPLPSRHYLYPSYIAFVILQHKLHICDEGLEEESSDAQDKRLGRVRVLNSTICRLVASSDRAIGTDWKAYRLDA